MSYTYYKQDYMYILYQWWRKSNHARWGSSWGNLWDRVQPSPDARWRGGERNLHKWGLCGRHHHQSQAQYLWSYRRRRGTGQPKTRKKILWISNKSILRETLQKTKGKDSTGWSNYYLKYPKTFLKFVEFISFEVFYYYYYYYLKRTDESRILFNQLEITSAVTCGPSG